MEEKKTNWRRVIALFKWRGDRERERQTRNWKEGREEGRGQPMNAREKWQITIVIKMAIWMIKGSLGLLRRRGRESGARKERMEGACS